MTEKEEKGRTLCILCIDLRKLAFAKFLIIIRHSLVFIILACLYFYLSSVGLLVIIRNRSGNNP